MNREEELLNIIKELRKEKRTLQLQINYLNNKNKYKRNYILNKEKHRNRFKINNKKWADANPKKIIEYREKHKGKIQIYRNTEEGKKQTKKSQWKYYGLNMENFEEIYKRYCETTNCDNCNILFTCNKKITSTTKCMDHSHITGKFRNILCHSCNTRRGENNL